MRRETTGQFLRFCLVGTSNAVVDFGILNALLWLRPTSAGRALLLYNTLAVLCAATNSFIWNRRFTFRVGGPVTRTELVRFAVVATGTAALNTAVLAALSATFPRLMASGLLGANLLKVGAIAGAMALSFFGMRLWVFLWRGSTAAEAPRGRWERRPGRASPDPHPDPLPPHPRPGLGLEHRPSGLARVRLTSF